MSNEYMERPNVNRIFLFDLQTSYRAELAYHLLERFGAIAAVDDGETSTGHPKMRLQTPAELVTRCCDIAAEAVDEFEKRGWVKPYTDLTDEQRAELAGTLRNIESEASFRRMESRKVAQ